MKMPRFSKPGKVRAVLAAGLVLGVGAAVTLAVWNDSEFATGTFKAGTFNIQGTTGDTTGGATPSPDWTDHATSGAAATLNFTANASALSPGDTVYAPFAVRVEPSTDYDASLTLKPAVITGDLASDLTTAVYESSYADCTAGTPGATKFSPTTLSKDGTPLTLCMAVTMSASAPNSAQGANGTVTWEFDATSVTP